MTDKPATLGDLIAQGAAQPDTQSAKAGAGQPIAQPADMRAEQAPSDQGAGQGAESAEQVHSAATSATSGISQSASADAIERVRRRVSEETQAMLRAFSTPFHGR
jgi:hypothetical protein